jgi:hypothetical protein
MCRVFRSIVSVAGVVVSLVTAIPANAEPRVATTWREPQESVAVAVDRAGRVYTATTGWHRNRGHGVVRAYRPDGSLRWERTWRPASTSVHAWAITVGPGGDVIVAGAINRYVEPGGCDEIWGWGWAIRAWNPDGNVAWQRLQPGWRTCDVFGTSGRVVDAAADTVAMGVWYGHEYGSWGYVVTFDTDGHRRWRRWIDPPSSENESIGDVAVGHGGSVYVAATRNLGALDDPERDQDAILVKLADDGSLRWIRAAPDASDLGVSDSDRGASVAVASRGVFFSSLLAESDGSRRIRLARYGTDGTLRWDRDVPRVSWWREADAFVGTSGHAVVLASAERNRGAGTHIALRGYGMSGGLRWHHHVGRIEERSWGPTALDANVTAVVVAGRPARVHDWTRVWLLMD